MTDTFTAYAPTALPVPVLAYLDAHDEKRHADVLATFAPDATVLDDGRTYEGIEAIGAWVERSATEFTYTATRVGQQVDGSDGAVVQIRLDGTFPGGTVTLRYDFRLSDGLIRQLTIAV